MYKTRRIKIMMEIHVLESSPLLPGGTEKMHERFWPGEPVYDIFRYKVEVPNLDFFICLVLYWMCFSLIEELFLPF
jgi:hypothetical protein